MNPANPVRGGGIKRIGVALAQYIGGEDQDDGQPMEDLGADAVAGGRAMQTHYLTQNGTPIVGYIIFVLTRPIAQYSGVYRVEVFARPRLHGAGLARCRFGAV